MEWSNFNGVVRFSNGGNSSDGRLNAATVQSSIGTRITSYQLTISPLRTPPPRSPMPDPPFKPISIIIRRYIGTYLPGLDRILAKIISLLQERTPCDPRPIVACPSECINLTLHSKASPYYLPLPHHLQSSVFVESCKVSSGKHEYAYQPTILTLRFPGPRTPPAAIR